MLSSLIIHGLLSGFTMNDYIQETMHLSRFLPLIFKCGGIDFFSVQTDRTDRVDPRELGERGGLSITRSAPSKFYTQSRNRILLSCSFLSALLRHYNVVQHIFSPYVTRCRGLVEGVYLFTLYALPLTIVPMAFGSDCGCKPFSSLIPRS